MILGVGIDRVDLEEFSRMPERGGNNTSKHVYTPWKKISYCRAQSRPLQHFAALGRKKKAIKVLGIAGTDGLRWPDFEIVSEPSGNPLMLLHGEAAMRCHALGVVEEHSS